MSPAISVSHAHIHVFSCDDSSIFDDSYCGDSANLDDSSFWDDSSVFDESALYDSSFISDISSTFHDPSSWVISSTIDNFLQLDSAILDRSSTGDILLM